MLEFILRLQLFKMLVEVPIWCLLAHFLIYMKNNLLSHRDEKLLIASYWVIFLKLCYNLNFKSSENFHSKFTVIISELESNPF